MIRVCNHGNHTSAALLQSLTSQNEDGSVPCVKSQKASKHCAMQKFFKLLLKAVAKK